MTNTALLIIDMQAGNFDDTAPIYNGDALLSNTRRLIQEARTSQIPIFYVQHCGTKGDIDEPGSPGWALHPDMTPMAEDTIVQKRFPDAFQDTTLLTELKAKDIEHLVIVGLQTEYCIDTTTRRAFSLGYKVTLVKDAHSSWDNDDLTAAQIISHHNRVLGDWFVTLKAVRDVQF